MHDREVDFYNRFGTLSSIPLPKNYASEKFGPDGKGKAYLLMEYLSDSGNMGHIVQGFSRHQLLNLAQDLARFQADFMKNQDKNWISGFEKEMPLNTINLMAGLFEKLKSDDLQFSEAVERLLPYLKDKNFADWTFYDGYKMLDLPPVMVHGNLWTNNIFMKQNSDGSLGNEAACYIDWQLSHAGTLQKNTKN